MSIVPGIVLVTGTCIAIDAVQEARITRFYSRASVLAQEAISSVKTVHAFWAQDKMVKGYDEYLQLARKEGRRSLPITGVCSQQNNFSFSLVRL
jgi:ATP-binding cassette subfamily B (MDR/TAP) protein 1